MINKNRIIQVLRTGQPEEKITIQGWVRTKRELKEFAFMEVSDGSYGEIIFEKSSINLEALRICEE